MSYLGEDTKTEMQENKPVNEGNYDVTLEDVRFDDTREDPRISLMWRMDNNMVLWTNLIFKDTTKGIISSALTGLGVKDEFKASDPKNHQEAAQSAMTIISKLTNNVFDVTVKHTPKNDGGVWVNTYVNEMRTKTVPNMAPSAKASTTFKASEEVPF